MNHFKLYFLSSIIFFSTLLPATNSTAARPVADKVLVKPGQIDWSADSKKLAYIRDGHVTIYNILKKTNQQFATNNPIFLDWQGNDSLLITNQTNEEVTVIQLTPSNGNSAQIVKDKTIKAALWVPSINEAIYIKSSKIDYSFGSNLKIMIAFWRNDAWKEIHHWEQTVGAQISNRADYLSGWLYQNFNTSKDLFLAPEFYRQPVIQAHIKVKQIHLPTGNSKEVFQHPAKNLTMALSMQAGTVAFSEQPGSLSLGMQGSIKKLTIDGKQPTGHYPSWHPFKPILFYGAHAINTDTNQIHPIDNMNIDSQTLAKWSNDGNYLAVTADNKLYIYSNIDM